MMVFIISSMTLSAQTQKKTVRKHQTTTRTVTQKPRSKLRTAYNGYKWYETSKYINGKPYIGAKNVSGKEVVPCKYHEVTCYDNYFKACTYNNICVTYSLDGNMLISEEMGYNDVSLDDGYYFCIKNNTLDVLNQNKDAILRNIEDIKYACIPYNSDRIKVQNVNGKYGLIDFKGNTIIPYKGNQGYNNILCEEDYYLCINDNRLDIIYKKKNTTKTIPLEGITSARDEYYNKEILVVNNANNKYCVVDFNGKVLIPFSDGYDDISFYDKNYIRVKKGKSAGLIDIKGNTIIDTSMGLTYIGRESVMCGKQMIEKKFWKAEKGEYVVFFTKEGRQHTPFVKIISGYEEVTPKLGKNSSVYFEVKRNGKVGICNSDGKLIIPIEYDFFGYDYENDNFRAHIKNGKTDYLNVSASGNISVTMKRAKDGYEYSEYYTTTPSGSKCGIKNAKDQFVIAPEYDFIWYDDSEHEFEVTNGNNYGRVDQKGNIIIPTSRGYNSIVRVKQYKSWYYRVSKNNKQGICNRYGKEILPPIYSSAFFDEYENNLLADGKNINVELGDNNLLNPNPPKPNFATANTNPQGTAHNYIGNNTMMSSTSTSTESNSPTLKYVSLFVVKYYSRADRYTCETSHAYVGQIGATIALYRNNNTIGAPFATGARRNPDTVNGGYKVSQYTYRAIGKPNFDTTAFYYFNY